MQSQIADLEFKLQKSVESVDELRTQLDTVSNERIQLLETVNKYERELGTLRSERNAVTEERDTLLRKVERQKLELERMQIELSSAETQLKNAITGKCEAIARLGDIESKEASVRMKEQRFEQERAMLNSQIQSLSDDLNRTTNELQSARSHSRMEMMHIETQLKNKTEEVRILERQFNQIQEENNELQRDADESRNKIDEYQKYIDRLRNELNAKTKLAELYKGEAIVKEQKTIEIIEAINDHKRMLREVENLHGEMETKMKAMTVKHEQDLQEIGKEIEELKCELKSCKELLIKTAQLDSVDISQIAPSAAVRLMRADRSITVFYPMFVKATEDLEVQKLENARIALQIKTILSELEKKAPQIQKNSLEYEKIVETNNIIAHQRDELLAKRNELEEELANAYAKISQLERLMKQDRQVKKDKSRQICYLLHEIKTLRFGDIADDMKNDHSSVESVSTDPNEIVSERSVTFKNITEMQEQNEKLIMCVRDLRNKVEEARQRESQDNQNKEKLESSVKKLHDLQETLNQQNTTITILLSKSERYKKLYFKTQKQLNKTTAANDSSMDVSSEEDDSDIDDDDSDDEKRSRKSPNGGKSENPKADKRMRELERDVSETKGKYNALKEQYKFYTKEKHNNEKLMNEQFDSLRSEVRELTSAVEMKYANELSLHSVDIQELTKIKTESIKIHDELLKLQNERDAAKDAYQQLKDNQDENLKLVENEKKDLENRIADLNTLNSYLHDQIEALITKLSTLTQPQTNAHIMAEVMDVKNKLLQKEETCQKLTEELDHKEAQLLDIKNKERQIRKIAKRYKDSFIELKAQTTGTEINAANAASTSQDQMDIEGGASVPNVVSLSTQVAENSKLRVGMEDLHKTHTNVQEENERMRKNSDLYKASLKNVDALRNDQALNLSITELKNAAEHELAEVKLQHAQTIENNEAVIRQHEKTIERMKRELIDQRNANKEERTRLTGENEQLNPQLGGLQQSAKPLTSSVATNKSCISASVFGMMSSDQTTLEYNSFGSVVFGNFGAAAVTTTATSTTNSGTTQSAAPLFAFGFAPQTQNISGGLNFGTTSASFRPAFNFAATNQPTLNFNGSSTENTQSSTQPFQFVAPAAPSFNAPAAPIFGSAPPTKTTSNTPFQFNAGTAPATRNGNVTPFERMQRKQSNPQFGGLQQSAKPSNSSVATNKSCISESSSPTAMLFKSRFFGHGPFSLGQKNDNQSRKNRKAEISDGNRLFGLQKPNHEPNLFQ